MDEISPSTLTGREGEAFTIAGKEFRLSSLATSDFAGGGTLTAVFAADAPHGLAQDICQVRHAELADADLLVVPSAPAEVCVTFTWLDQTQ